jgi:hypothetical protein
MMRLLSFALAALFSSTAFVSAQDITGLERPLNLIQSPQYPAPGEEVALSVASYAMDLDRSTLRWYIDGTLIAEGSGQNSITTTAGKLGSRTRIVVTAEDQDGILGRAEAVIAPSEVEILWEGDSYAPPFYKGRTLAGPSGVIRAHALARLVRPNGSSVREADIVYTWYRNNTRIASGRGKSSVTFGGPALYGSEDISVTAESIDAELRGEAKITIQATDPKVELYENHPLFGVLYHRALVGSVSTVETEQKVAAVPYFANTRSPRDSALEYAWTVNGKTIEPDPKSPELLTIISNGYRGPANVTLKITSADDLVMRSTGAWSILFTDVIAPLFANPFRQN